MSISAILQELDVEIAWLQQAKQLLSGMSQSIPSSGVRGNKDGAGARPKCGSSPKDYRGTKEALGSPEEIGKVTKHVLWLCFATSTTQSVFPAWPALDLLLGDLSLVECRQVINCLRLLRTVVKCTHSNTT
jgi:hypothetical protein